MSELKNCPFCGGTNIAAFDMFEYDVAVVGCRDCSAQVRAPQCDAAYSAKLWNARTASPRFTEGEREAMGNVIGFAKDGAEMGFENDLRINGEEHASCAMNAALRGIATVRKMLEAEK